MFRKKKRCFRCNKDITDAYLATNKDTIFPNEYGYRCAKPCKVTKGSFEYMRRYWISEFLKELYAPDYMQEDIYEKLWQDAIELIGVTDPLHLPDVALAKERVRAYPLHALLKKKYKK